MAISPIRWGAYTKNNDSDDICKGLKKVIRDRLAVEDANPFIFVKSCRLLWESGVQDG